MVTFMIYLLVMCEQIAIMVGGFAEFFTFTAAISAVLAVVVSFISVVESDDGLDTLFQEPDDRHEGGFWKKSVGKSMLKTWKWIACLAIMFHVVEGLIPSQKNMAMIIAGSATYHAVTSEPAQRIGGKALTLLEKKLDEAIDSVDKKSHNSEQEQSKSTAL